MKIVKDRGFYRNILSIALPLALMNLITFSTNMMDTIMLGQADSTGVLLSASSLANQPFFLLTLICFGFGGASSVLSAQYWGKKDLKSIRTVYALTLQAVFAVSLLAQLAVLILPEQIMGLYSNNPEIIERGAEYLRIYGFAYVFFALSNTLCTCVRSVEIVKIGVAVNLASLVTNIFLNWVFIFGNLGAPAMGIKGAALATLIARIIEFLITFGYICFIDKKLKFRIRHLFRFHRILARDLLVHGAPVLINEIAYGLAVTVQAAIFGHITYSQGDPVAANSITTMVQQLSTIVLFGVANAAAIVVGKSIGEGKQKQADLQANTFKYLSMGLGILCAGVILLLRGFVVNLYDIPIETKELAKELMVVIAFVTIFVSIGATFIIGILRGGGDTHFCLATELSTLWLIAIPFAAAAAFWFHWPVPVVLLCMKADEPIKAVVCFVRYTRGKWLKTVTRDFKPKPA